MDDQEPGASRVWFPPQLTYTQDGSSNGDGLSDYTALLAACEARDGSVVLAAHEQTRVDGSWLESRDC